MVSKKLAKLLEDYHSWIAEKLLSANIERVSVAGQFIYRRLPDPYDTDEKFRLLCSKCCDYWMIGEYYIGKDKKPHGYKPKAAVRFYAMTYKETGEELYIPTCDDHDEDDFELCYDCTNMWDMSEMVNPSNFGFNDRL